MRKFLSFAFLAYLFTSSLWADPIKLEMWHAMEGFIEERLKELVDRFNTSQKEVEIRLIYKGNYTETYKEGVKAAKGTGDRPHILQVYEIATPTFMQEQDIYIPVADLFQKHGFAFSQEALLPAIIDFYSDDKGHLLGFPFNISTGLLYYNKDTFQKAGLDPNSPPKTWENVEKVALALRKAGNNCALTTAWPSGYLLEHFGARHNLPFTTKDNGFKGENAKLLVNANPYIYNISKLGDWQKAGLFQYAGRDVKKPEELFTSGHCAMLLQGTPRMTMLQKAAKFEVGVGPLPYWKSLTNTPHNLVTGGAALWAIKGHSTKEEKAMAVFFNFVAQPENQQRWAEATGYMPISKAAYQLSLNSGYYKKNPQAKIGIESLMLPSTPYSKGIRLPGFVEVREVLIDALEAVFENRQSAKKALNEAVEMGNHLIHQTAIQSP